MNGNRMTKILAVLICAFMLIQCTAIGAFAEDIAPEAVVLVKPEVKSIVANQVGTNYIYVDVVTENCKKNDQTIMAYLVSDAGELLTIGYAPVRGNKADITLGVSDAVETDTYRIIVALNSAEDVFEGEVFYIGTNDVTGFFETINLTDVEASVVREKLDVNYNALSVIEFSEDEEGNIILKLTGEDYENLNEEAKDAFSQLILNGVNGDEDHMFLKGKYDARNSEKFVKEAFIIADYNETDACEALAEQIYRFESVIGFEAEDAELYGKINNKESFAKVAKTVDKKVDSIDELKEVVEIAAAIQLVNETHFANLVNVVEKYNEIFKIDEDEIEELLENKTLRLDFCEVFAGTFYSVDELQDAWDNAFEEVKDDEFDDEPSYGGGGGGGGGGGSSAPKKDSVSTQITNSENNYDPNVAVMDYYTDMAGYQWSSEAVLNLTKAGILSGYGDKTFGPGRTLTRAEFIKMIVNVFSLADISATSSFTDVDKDAWYYIYIASAEKYGLAQGYGNGLFGVNDPVTRQDAVTLVYRAAKAKGVSTQRFYTSAEVFKDKAEIAPYALEAVEALYNAGIYTDAYEPTTVDVFAPKKLASRAYIAVVLNQVYLYMK